MSRSPLHLFEGFGVELEYMIVDSDSLDIAPLTDAVLHDVSGSYQSEVEVGDISWSNELVLHVIELKTNGPAADLAPLADRFQQHVVRVNALLKDRSARLMPSAMHPWMDPDREMRLWPHEYNAIYEAFNRVFDCRGHGWANLQSTHLNLPFGDDDEFGRLHAAIRLVLPLLPALAASSPVFERRASGLMDSRLGAYRSNARSIPLVSGDVIPEPIYTRADYDRVILQPLYAAIAPHDPDGVLQDEFLNARGAIARFQRNAIEIRVLDVQECPQADLAVCGAVVAVLQALVHQQWSSWEAQKAFPSLPLVHTFQDTIRDADQARVTDLGYLRLVGAESLAGATTGELWRYLLDRVAETSPATTPWWRQAIDTILDHGPLARRILRQLDGDMSDDRLRTVYGQLSDCLAAGHMFGVPR